MKILFIFNLLVTIALFISSFYIPKKIGQEINNLDLESMKSLFTGFIAALLALMYTLLGILVFLKSYTLLTQ